MVSSYGIHLTLQKVVLNYVGTILIRQFFFRIDVLVARHCLLALSPASFFWELCFLIYGQKFFPISYRRFIYDSVIFMHSPFKRIKHTNLSSFQRHMQPQTKLHTTPTLFTGTVLHALSRHVIHFALSICTVVSY